MQANHRNRAHRSRLKTATPCTGNMRCMEQPTTNILSSPGDIIAAIPGILGYYPHESVIIIGFHYTGPEGLSLGPVMRTDITNVAALWEAAHTAPASESDVVLAFVITRTPECSHGRVAIETLEQIYSLYDEPFIDACWSLSEIAMGSHYHLEFGEIARTGWGSGVISSVIHSAAMRPLIEQGQLPALTRDEALNFFATPHAVSDGVEDVVRLAYARADELVTRLQHGKPGPAEALEQAQRILSGLTPHPLLHPPHSDQVWGAFEEEDDLLTIATVLARSQLRDCLVTPALDQPASYAAGLLSTALMCSGVIRANALSLWAIVALHEGVVPAAHAALAVVIEELPGHSLAGALQEGLSLGAHDALIDAVREGSRQQRRLAHPHYEERWAE